eukprot:m.26066 g.26066  ORF g.26066 m.26066 type:complete len:57 (-) comp8784_c0_seq1:419-589(-)
MQHPLLSPTAQHKKFTLPCPPEPRQCLMPCITLRRRKTVKCSVESRETASPLLILS